MSSASKCATASKLSRIKTTFIMAQLAITVLSSLASLKAQTIRFTDVTQQKNARGNVINNVSCYGHGVAFAEISGDSLLDIYISNAVRDANDLGEVLYISVPGGPYSEEADLRGVHDPYGATGSHGICFVDYDNDGDFDIYNATTDNRNRLYRNNGSGYFNNVSSIANLPRLRLGTRGVVAFDANNDGYMDLLGVNWGPVEDANGDPQITPPQPNEFYLNKKDGTFRRETSRGITPENPSNLGTQGVTAIDVDNDGDMDVFVCHRNYAYLGQDENGNDMFGPDWSTPTPNELFINNGSGYFTEQAQQRGLYSESNDCNGTTFADYDNDGDLDAFVVPKQFSQRKIRIYNNDGSGNFTDVTNQVNIEQWGFSALLFDVDNDGDLDAYSTRTRRRKNALYINDGSGNFSVTSNTGMEKLCWDPRGGAIGDIDNDGDLDVYFVDANKDTSSNYTNYLLRNDTQTDNRWLKVLVRGPEGDLGGFGSKIWVFDQGHMNDMAHLVGYKQVINAYGYLCQDDPIQHFGLGQRDTVDVKVQMLDGTTLSIPSTHARQRLFVSKPQQIVKSSGDNQEGNPSTALPEPLVVTAYNRYGQPTPGAAVTFEIIQGEGQLSEHGTIYTDVSGKASVMLTLGPITGQTVVHATSPGLQGSPVAFTASTIGGFPTTMELVNGDGQTGPINAPLSNPIAVRIKDNLNGNVPDFPVNFEITDGGGLINGQGAGPITIQTDANGIASVSWTLGPLVGSDNNAMNVSAQYNGEQLQNSPFIFHASASPGTETVITKRSGDGQVGSAGEMLAMPLVVEVADSFGNVKADVAVAIQVLTGGGTINGETSTTVITNTSGQASVNWRLGTTLGDNAQSLRASVLGNSQSFVTFFATALPGPPVQLNLVSGDQQSGVVGQRLPQPLVIEAFDQHGVPCVGLQSTFRVTNGGGNIAGDSLFTTLLNEQGRASANWVLGEVAGNNTNSCQASVEGLQQSITFEASSIATSPYELIMVSGDSQIVRVGNIVPQPLTISVSDTFGNAVADHEVNFEVKGGDCNIGGAANTQVLTDADGMANVQVSLGTTSGICRISARSEWESQALQGSPINFIVITTATPTRLKYVSGDSTEGLAGQLAPEPLRVKVSDDYGNPVIEHVVQFVSVAGGGSFSGQPFIQVTTNKAGIASATPMLGPSVGDRNNVFEARAFGDGGKQLQGSPIRFTLSGRSTTARKLIQTAGNNQIGTIGQELDSVLAVQVLTANDVGVAGFGVTFKIVQGGGKFVGYQNDNVQVQTDENGTAGISYQLGFVAGMNIIEAIATDGESQLDGSPVRFYASARAGKVDVMKSTIEATGPVIADGVSQSLITITLVDGFDNPISQRHVSLTVTGTGNTIQQPAEATGDDGVASGYLTSTRAETKTVTASVSEDDKTLDSAAQVIFLPGAAKKVAMFSGDGQQGLANQVLHDPLIVSVTDIYDNGIADYPVEFAVVNGEGKIVEPQPVITDSQGLARSHFILGPTQQAQTVEARASQLDGSPVIFQATLTTRQVARIEKVSGDGQIAPPGTSLPNPLVVRVFGNDGQPYAGVPVNFAILQGDAQLVGSVPDSSDEHGLAKAYIAFGTTPGIVQVVATVDILNDSLIFNATISAVLPSRMTLLIGQNQEATVGHDLPQPLAVYVTDSQSQPVVNVPVWFTSKTEGGAVEDNQPVYTGSNGVALAQVRLGTKSGQYRFEAEHPGLQGSPVIFLANAAADQAVAMALLAGNGQSARPHQQLPEPLKVKVSDQYDNGVQGVDIQFVVTQGGGDLADPQPVKTDNNGVAETRWLLGLAGDQRAQAKNDSLAGSPVEFSAEVISNSAPMISTIADTSIIEGQELKFFVKVSDPERDEWKLGARNLPTGAQFDSTNTGLFSWTPSSEQTGTHQVVFTAKDTLGASSQAVTTIRVGNINHAPFIVSYQPIDSLLAVGVGQALTFSVQVSDADNDSLTYAWYLAGMYVGNNTTFTLVPNETLPPQFYIQVRVSDPWETIQFRWRIEVEIGIELSFFNGNVSNNGGVWLRWETTEERDVLGFHILRAERETGPYERINKCLLSTNANKKYFFEDDDIRVGKTYFYKLQNIGNNGGISEHGPITIHISTPIVYELRQSYPNPFSLGRDLNFGKTINSTIVFKLPQQAHVSIRIFNIFGQEVKGLADSNFQPGTHKINWDGKNHDGVRVPAGVYYYTMCAGSFKQTKKLVVLR